MLFSRFARKCFKKYLKLAGALRRKKHKKGAWKYKILSKTALKQEIMSTNALKPQYFPRSGIIIPKKCLIFFRASREKN